MKKALLIAAAVMFVASSISAAPAIGYIGIFKDATHATDPAANTVCPPQYGQAQAWIWCLPSVNGLQAAEFAVLFPATTVVLATVKNPIIAVELGSLAGGMSAAIGEGLCQTDWAWLYQLTIMSLLPAGVPQQIAIIAHPGTVPPEYHFATCEAGYPIEPCINLTPLYFCWNPDPGPLGVQETNWGAIKSLF